MVTKHTDTPCSPGNPMLQLTGSWKASLQPCLSALPCTGSCGKWGKGFGGAHPPKQLGLQAAGEGTADLSLPLLRKEENHPPAWEQR